ncbi:unnamed protein product [Caenorhabditis auriculariae]|uniref:N-terminal methionine N(alpha)-acetyltransferase NatC n=1 Tax=Caenorhabditis auriculariae TaxID=2777116 RepID=A0A8S1HST3_9PELO|nr:unnamed protein product [Caenorhabditis auriculariae]
MAIGSQKQTTSNLDVTIGTLRRCLGMVVTSNRSVSPQSKEEGSSCMEEAVPERSKWPHCQHLISHDEPRAGEQPENIRIVQYKDENQIGDIMRLITKDLSEPYSIYTYRYFIHNWPELCLLAYDTNRCSYVGAVVCKLERNSEDRRKGYVAMLAVDESCRRLGLGTKLVRRAIQNMQAQGCDEVVLETEVSNKNAQRLYSNLGFIREKRLIRYYLNGGDAFRLKLIFSTAYPIDVYYQRELAMRRYSDDDQ